MEKVIATQDSDGHWYVIPFKMKDEFDTLLELSDLSADAEDQFIDKFSDYMTGGDLNNIQLYAEI